MSYTTPPTFVASDPLAAADLNILGDDIVYLKGQVDGLTLSGVNLRRAATQSISNSSDTDVSFDTELADFGGWWSSGTTVTVPAGAIPGGATTIGVDIHIAAKFATDGTGKRKASILIEGSVLDSWKVQALDDDNTSVYLASFAEVAAGDEIKLQVWQNSGGALNISEARLTIERRGIAS